MTRFEVGYSKTPLHRKLGCKPDRMVWLVGAPEGFADYLTAEGFSSTSVQVVVDVPEGAAHVHLFTTSAKVVIEAFAVLSERLDRHGQVWVSWPKKASRIATDITKDILHNSEVAGKLVDIKVCAVDATWSGLKYVVRKELR